MEDQTNPTRKYSLATLAQNRRKPTQCHLWDDPDIITKSFDDFAMIKSYEDSSHFDRALIKCTQCNQLYFYEFYEEIDWEDGDDPQYITLIPVESEQEADLINSYSPLELLMLSPRLCKDSPKGKETSVYWFGKQANE